MPELEVTLFESCAAKNASFIGLDCCWGPPIRVVVFSENKRNSENSQNLTQKREALGTSTQHTQHRLLRHPRNQLSMALQTCFIFSLKKPSFQDPLLN